MTPGRSSNSASPRFPADRTSRADRHRIATVTKTWTRGRPSVFDPKRRGHGRPASHKGTFRVTLLNTHEAIRHAREGARVPRDVWYRRIYRDLDGGRESVDHQGLL